MSRGGKRPGAGRPIGTLRGSRPESRTTSIRVAVNQEEKEAVNHAAEETGETESEYIRTAIRERMGKRLR